MSDDDTIREVQPAAVEIDKIDDTGESSVAAAVPVDGDSSPTIARRRAIPVVALALVSGLSAAAGLAGWLYFSQYRPDTQTDAAVEQSAVNSARDGTVALLSYKPETLQQDLDSAKNRLTGDFLHYYEQFSKQVITPAAQTKGVSTTAQVVGAAATELHPGSAVVLVFVNQVTTSKERPDPSMASSSVLVSLSKQNGTWLINKFDPI